MPVYEIVMLLILAGFLATSLGGIIGIGGGVIMMPIMIWMGINSESATLYSLSAIFVMSLISNYKYLQNSKPNYKAWLFILSLAIPAEFVGSFYVAPKLADNQFMFNLIFLILLLIIAVLMFFKTRLKFKYPIWLSCFLGAFVGLASGSLGIGGGILLVPGLMIFFNFKSKKAATTAMLVKSFTALTGAFTLLAKGNVSYEWWYFVIIIGAVLGSLIGTEIHLKVNNKHVTIILWLTILALIVKQIVVLSIGN